MAYVYKESQIQKKKKKNEKIIQLKVSFLLGYNMKAVIQREGNKILLGRGEKSTGLNFLGGKGMSMLLSVGGTPPFSFTRGEIPERLPSNNVGKDAKKIE